MPFETIFQVKNDYIVTILVTRKLALLKLHLLLLLFHTGVILNPRPNIVGGTSQPQIVVRLDISQRRLRCLS